ncbi:MAG: B12-binding domain-containing radical SAM protein [Deltaproteobacteria bacterium]|nr:B12-binding domain-containing radical SAM protein [Deltaproteobacteria bacterium]
MSAATKPTELLFAHAYFLRFDRKLYEAMQPYPPMGTIVAAAVARQAGREVALFDAMLAHDERAFEAALVAHKPRLVVLYEDNFNYLSKMCLLRMREAALVMLAAARRHGVRAWVCGSDASDHPAPYLDAGAELVLVGEGDDTLADLLARGWDKDPVDADVAATLAGLCFRRGGELVRTPRRATIKAMDALPWPAWDLCDLDHYRRIWKERHGRFSLNLVSTRGCPYHCNWCAKPIWGQRYAMHSPEQAAVLATHLRETFGAEHLWWMDDIFGLKKGWVGAFGEAMRQRGGTLPFKALSRADLLVRPGEADAFADAGAEVVWMGAESGSQTVLDAMDKGTKVEEIEEATRLLHGRGVEVAYFLQFGYPGETRADIEATRAMLRRCKPDDIGISVSYPLPGTRFHDRVADQLGVKQHWIDSSDLDMLYEGPFPTAFYRHLHRVVHMDYKSRRTLWRLRGQTPRSHRPSPRELARAAVDSALLPIAEARLDHLAALPHQGVRATGATMDFDAAATPSAPDGSAQAPGASA